MKASRMALGGLCLWMLGGVGAEGAVLAPASVSGSVFFNFTPPPRIDFSAFGTFSQSGPGGMVQFSSMATPAPSLKAGVEVNSGYYGRSSGMLVYEMQITGPGGSVPVNVQVAGSAAGSSITTHAFASFALKALWSLESVSGGQLLVSGEGINTASLQGSYSESFSKTHELMLTAGHIYRITMVADAGAAAGVGLSASGSAYIDPIFSFGAGVGSEYSFAFSEGIGNAAGTETPEPGAMGMIAVGACVLVWLGRLRIRLG